MRIFLQILEFWLFLEFKYSPFKGQEKLKNASPENPRLGTRL
jgi:hypothetical protein